MKAEEHIPTSEPFNIGFGPDRHSVPENPLAHFAKFMIHHESGDFAKASERERALARLGWSIESHPITGLNMVRRRRGRIGK
jgi:hypothetical protein